MRERGVKCIEKSKKNGSNSCPGPANSLHPAIIDAFTVPTRQPGSDVGVVPRGSRSPLTATL